MFSISEMSALKFTSSIEANNGISLFRISPSLLATGNNENLESNTPASGLPKCEIKTVFEFCFCRYSRVGMIARILASSKTLPSFTGTFKSTLRATVLFKTSVSPNFLIF